MLGKRAGAAVAAGLVLALVAVGCGQEARSAEDHEALRVSPAEEHAANEAAAVESAPVERAASPAPGEVEESARSDVSATAPVDGVAAQQSDRTEPEEEAAEASGPERVLPAPPPPGLPLEEEVAEGDGRGRQAQEVGEDAPSTVRTRRSDPVPLPDLPDFATHLAGPVVPRGTMIPLELGYSLSTETHREGDTFIAWVVDDVLDPSGMVLIPADAQVRGVVLESRRSDGSDEPALLAVGIETLLIDGHEYPVVASVVEAEQETAVGDSDTETAAKVVAGAAAGAILGRLLGRDRSSTVRGAVAGAAAGTAVAMATRQGDAVMREGALIVIRLEEGLELESRER